MEHSADQLSLTRVLHLLRCPRCCELPPAGPIYACERGHTLCGRCYDHLEKGGEPDEAFRCVVCHARLCGDRNMVAEQLVRSLGKRALARSRQRMVGLEDGMVGVVSDRRPSLIVIRSNTDNPPVTLPPPPPPAPLPTHSRPRPRPKPSSLFSAHASVPCVEQPCRPGCTCTRCTAMIAFYNAWLPSENTQMPDRLPTHHPPTPPLVPPETPSPREASPGPPATGTCPTHYHAPYHPLHSSPLPAPPPPRVASASTRPRSPVPADDGTPWTPAAAAGGVSAAASAAASRRGGTYTHPRPPPSAASGTSSAMAAAADAYRPHPGGDASAFACACRCTCVYSCPCARANPMYAGAASSSSMPVCGSQSTAPEERRLPSMRPVRCPKPSCSTLLSASALVQHFAFDHSEVPLLPVDPGDETQLWLSASDIPLEMAKVQALLLLPILSGDKGSLRPTSEPLMSRYGLRRPLPLLTGRCRLATGTECGTMEDNSKPRRVGDETGAENSLHTTSANTSTDVTINSTSATANPDEVDDEDHSVRKEDTIVMWLADVEAATNYSMEVSDGVRKYSYSAPAVALRSPQTPRSVFRSGEAATLTGSFVRRVARAGGFTLTVVVQ